MGGEAAARRLLKGRQIPPWFAAWRAEERQPMRGKIMSSASIGAFAKRLTKQALQQHRLYILHLRSAVQTREDKKKRQVFCQDGSAIDVIC